MSAILVPGVNHRLLSGKSKTLLQPQIINVHTMVWDLNNCERYFAQAGKPYSHFGTGHDGEIRQWQDLRYRAASCYNGNPYNISIENADKGTGFPAWSGSDVPEFTDAQADSLVVLISWLCHRFGLPKAAVGTSCPHERGIGWHRLGIDPWRNTVCGRKWSSARGKVCPGDRRIAQLQREIIPAVSSPIPPPPSQEDDMPTYMAWFRTTEGSDKNMHCYRIVGSTCTWFSTEREILTAQFFGVKWMPNVDPVLWKSMAVMNGPLKNV